MKFRLKNRAIFFLANLLAFTSWGCHLSSSSDDPDMIAGPLEIVLDDKYAGFLKVASSGRFVFMGTNSEDALAKERPLMKAKFSYDFSIGKSEVTCGSFRSLMDRGNCDGDDLPVVNVSYYDAVLYCNALSKRFGLDSVYSYSSASFGEDGYCDYLEGLVFNPEREGIRLPTESEWMLVAAQDWLSGTGWTMENSDGTLHPVCSIGSVSSSASVCDMKGNAMEWVNDWMGSFREHSVSDFVGAQDGGSQGIRVVKGGSFRNEALRLHLFRRGDVYAVTSSSRANYIGFRVAYGKIPNPTWLGSNGNEVSNPILLLASSLSVKKRTGTFDSKLVFRNDVTGNLAFVNYSSANPTIVEIQDELDAYHPDVSPDGRKVAFCTGMEGTGTVSSVYVRNLDSAGSDLVKLNVENAVIPRWKVLDIGDTVIVYVTSANDNRDGTAFLKQSTWQVPFVNGKFGTPKKLFDGAFHGGVSSDNQLAVTGARLLRARVDGKDSLWYNGEQACNVSLSKDVQRRTLFLDFGGKTGTAFSGEKYGVHERILEADSAGRLTRMIPAPEGYSFDHSEWALWNNNTDADNAPLAVASLTGVNGSHKKLAVVNMSDSSILELAQGDELWHPCLWSVSTEFHIPKDVDLDSAGVYLLPGGNVAGEILRVKMELMWKNAEQIEYFCVGSSRMANGVIPDSLTVGYAMNMGHAYNDMNASIRFARDYGFNALPNLKAIVISLDFDLWQIKTDFSKMIFDVVPGYSYDSSHYYWKYGMPNGFIEAVEHSFPASEYSWMVYGASRGFADTDIEGWGPAIIEGMVNWDELYPDRIQWNLDLLRKFLIETQKRNISVVGVIFPQNPEYAQTDSWGCHGLQRSTAQRVRDSVFAMAEQYQNFVVMDENKMGSHDYSDQMAHDTDHLSTEGAAQLTSRLDSLLLGMQ